MHNNHRGNKCRNCGGILEEKPSKMHPKKLTKNYYFTHTLRCNKCDRLYLSEDYMVLNDRRLKRMGKIRNEIEKYQAGLLNYLRSKGYKKGEIKQVKIWMQNKQTML